MTKVREGKVIVETLPSSNVRISQYQGFDEHHAQRWMRIPGHLVEGDPSISVALGSDDPGIFAADLRGEFYQLFAQARRCGVAEEQALGMVGQINDNGRIFRFHP